MKNIIRELLPIDGRKSFYGKCKEMEDNESYWLLSYGTIICSIDKKDGKFIKYCNEYGHSPTTKRHLDAFRQAHEMEKIGKKEWEEMEVFKI